MPEDPKRLIVVGDRVLISPEEGEERTNVGLYLPPSAIEGRQVQGGRIVATGPGTPMPEPASMDEEPWKIHGAEVKYLPTRAEAGGPSSMPLRRLALLNAPRSEYCGARDCPRGIRTARSARRCSP